MRYIPKHRQSFIINLFHPYVPRHMTSEFEKEVAIKDHSFSKSLMISVLGILVCICALSGATWAWYTTTVESNANHIEAANYDLEVSISPEATKADDGYLLNSSEVYTVTLQKAGTAETGFCHILVTQEGGGSTVYYSPGIPNASGENDPFCFTVTGMTKLVLTPMWGSYTEEGTILSPNAQIGFAQ